jgi:hypothetical protein
MNAKPGRRFLTSYHNLFLLGPEPGKLCNFNVNCGTHKQTIRAFGSAAFPRLFQGLINGLNSEGTHHWQSGKR